MSIWGFPKIGLPPNHPFLDGIFPYKPSSYWGTPINGNPHMIKLTYINRACQVRHKLRRDLFSTGATVDTTSGGTGVGQVIAT